jgi:dihydropyrimidinase
VTEPLAICGGRVLTPEGERVADVRVDGERIVAVEPPAESHPGHRVIDATGRYVLPGSVDAHVHVQIPYVLLDGSLAWSADSFPEASNAAAIGGTTTIIDFAMQSPGEDLLGPLEERLAFIAPSNVDVALHCWVMEAGDLVLGQIPDLVARGVPSLKAFMAYSQLGVPMDDGELYDLFDAVGAAGGLLALHAENAGLNARRIRAARDAGRTGYREYPRTRPAIGEEEAVSRALVFGASTRTPTYFVHLSTAGAVRRLAEAKRAGQRAYGETCPHFLFFDESAYLLDRAGDFMMAPPLRTATDQIALRTAIDDRVLDVVATDHTSWPRAIKNYGEGFPESIQGVAGLGLLTPLMAAAAARGELDWSTVARVTAQRPAEIFGLAPRKGVIAPGSDADLLVLDPARVAPVAQVPPHWVVENCIYSGLPALYPDLVLRRGELLAESGRYVGPAAGSGRFVAGAPHPVESE